jgi:hypothetical protein
MLEELKGERTLRELADQVGCSQTLLSFVLNRKRDAGPKILKFLGLERVKPQVSYRKRNGRSRKNGSSHDR